ncbi:hypothetical protein AB0F43_07570 [Kribbella sp. NPDC023972]|uniref:hypothetical protein n=1 Tax=Kribbella sp. NPDC023972 TaxID=3154795 RepID=UPI003409A611
MDEGWYRFAMVVVAFFGVWEGVITLIFRLWTDKEPTALTAANHLDAPWCYIVAAGAIVVALALLAVLGNARAKVLAKS